MIEYLCCQRILDKTDSLIQNLKQCLQDCRGGARGDRQLNKVTALCISSQTSAWEFSKVTNMKRAHRWTSRDRMILSWGLTFVSLAMHDEWTITYRKSFLQKSAQFRPSPTCNCFVWCFRPVDILHNFDPVLRVHISAFLKMILNK